VHLLDVASRRARPSSVHVGVVRDLALSPDGTQVASVGDDATVRIADTRTGTASAVLHGHSGRVHAVAFSPDGRSVVSAGADAAARLWSVPLPVSAARAGHQGAVRDLAFVPGGHVLVSAGADGEVGWWDASSFRTWTADTRGELVYKIAVLGAPPRVVSAARDGFVRAWDETGAPIGTLKVEGRVIALDGFTDGRVVYGTARAQVGVWEPTSGAHVVLPGATGRIAVVRFSPDGARVAAAGDDRVVREWDSRGGPANTIGSLEDKVTALVYTHAGGWLVAGARDGVVRAFRDGSQRDLGRHAGRSRRSPSRSTGRGSPRAAPMG
jgi:WD40 repeat protein